MITVSHSPYVRVLSDVSVSEIVSNYSYWLQIAESGAFDLKQAVRGERVLREGSVFVLSEVEIFRDNGLTEAAKMWRELYEVLIAGASELLHQQATNWQQPTLL